MYQGRENATHNTALYQGICMNEQSDELFSHCFLNIVWNFDVFSLVWHRYMNKKITIDVTTFLEHYLGKTLTWRIEFWVILTTPTISFYFQGKHFLIIKVPLRFCLYKALFIKYEKKIVLKKQYCPTRILCNNVASAFVLRIQNEFWFFAHNMKF